MISKSTVRPTRSQRVLKISSGRSLCRMMVGWQIGVSLLSVQAADPVPRVRAPATSAVAPVPAAVQSDDRSGVSNLVGDDFAARLWLASNGENGTSVNRVLAPAALFETLVLLHAVADGQTRQELASVLLATENQPDGKVLDTSPAQNSIERQRALIQLSRLPLVNRFPATVEENGVYGVRVASVDEGVFEVEPGDLLFRVGDTPIHSLEDFQRSIAGARGTVNFDAYSLSQGTVQVDQNIGLKIVSDNQSPVQRRPAVASLLVCLSDQLPAPAANVAEDLSSLGAALQRVRFADPLVVQAAVNQSVQAKTEGRIASVPLPMPLDPALRLLFVAADSVDVKWLLPFQRIGQFQFKAPAGERLAEGLQVLIRTKVIQAQRWTAVALPYRQTALELWLFLPRGETTLTEVERDTLADPALWNRVEKALRKQRVDLTIPRLRVESSESLKAGLQQLGLTKLFTSRAELSRLAPGVGLGYVLQSAFIEWDELGTRGGSRTVAGGLMGTPADPDLKLVFDRPFLFSLRHPQAGPLLMGRIVDPLFIPGDLDPTAGEPNPAQEVGNETDTEETISE